MWSEFEIAPMLARQTIGTRRISPLGNVASPLAFAVGQRGAAPALGQICPPRPGCISMLWTVSAQRILPIGRQLPTRASASAPDGHRVARLQPIRGEDVCLLPVRTG